MGSAKRLGRIPVYVAVAALAATTAQPAQCPQQREQEMLSNPKLTAQSATYVTRPGDTPYSLAKRFYGHGYLEYKIRIPNQALLTPKGVFISGSTILVPPDDNGDKVDVRKK